MVLLYHNIKVVFEWKTIQESIQYHCLHHLLYGDYFHSLSYPLVLMSKTSSRILSRKLVFLYYYARLFNEEILSLPPEIEETKKITEQPSHEDLSEIADWL